MAETETDLPPVERKSVATPRLLGTLGMLAGPMLLVGALLSPFGLGADGQNSRTMGVLGVIYIGGWICSAVAMRMLRVTGRGAGGKAAFVIQIIGLSLALLFSVQEIINPNPDSRSLLFNITDAAWPLSHLFMLVVGALVLRAGVWRGWRRLPPFLCGLALPIFFAAMALGAGESAGLLFPVLTAVGFMTLGYAVRSSRPGGQ
jgi:hypothetical protein